MIYCSSLPAGLSQASGDIVTLSSMVFLLVFFNWSKVCQPVIPSPPFPPLFKDGYNTGHFSALWHEFWFNEKSDRFCANSSTSLLSHCFWSCVWSQWPTENWWFHPGLFTCASRSINFLSPLQLQRAQLQEWASDQGCSLHLSHWARVFPHHLMLHELLGGFFPVFLPFLAIVGRGLAFF